MAYDLTTNVADIAVGYFGDIAILKNGTVVAWGDNSFGQASPPSNLSNVVGITAGASCPNNLLEETIHRLYEFRGVEVEKLLPADYREIVGLAPPPVTEAHH